jgi:uncharacterized membrane protein YgcG
VVADGDADAVVGAADVHQLALQRLQVVARVLAEDRDEEIFLAVEVEVDRAVGDAGRLRDLGDLGVEVAVAGEDVDRRAEDALALARAAERLAGLRAGLRAARCARGFRGRFGGGRFRGGGGGAGGGGGDGCCGCGRATGGHE